MERLNQLYNISKHADERIKGGELPPAGSLPIWLASDGLQSKKVSLSYGELASILTDLSALCCKALDVIDNAGGDKKTTVDGSQSGQQIEKAKGDVMKITLD